MAAHSSDIVIIGSGIAGATAALALAPSARVTIIDKLAQPPARPGECLPAPAGRILRKLGLWQEFLQQSHRVSLGVQSYWGTAQAHIQDSLRNPDGHGWHLNRPEFESLLQQTAEARGVNLLNPATVTAARRNAASWQLTLNNGDAINTGWVIDATGRNACFARQQGAQRTSDDSLIAAWGIITQDIARGMQRSMATIAAAENGWWYSAPLPNNQRLLAYHTDQTLLNTAQWRHPEPFKRAALQQSALADLGIDASLATLDYRGITAAHSTKLNQVCGNRWAAIGDAAISFDPLSSQGMYNAMASAMQFAELFQAGAVTREYPKQVQAIWQHYVNHKAFFYGQERRFVTQPFWQDRQRDARSSTA
ncbi:tryptophan 7-halogenase [uncultured Gilvimarinus sp.]|uniref:NAD(P)/FAD-dependent oxidoreductase n=1 Tax=uncultured Gilvimarinus sp. TaxID=1689143 RepID=UPI0030EC5B2E|tara:strand:- start:4426 stop:5520 length:1095 start_codon:yes stop_codon:yes gene_type:complete